MAVHSAACGPAAVASWAAVVPERPAGCEGERVAARTGSAAGSAKGRSASRKNGAASSGAGGNGEASHGGRGLVIVESPAKARTIAGYLGKDYVVESSIGHIRDLPRSAADIPAAYKGESWAR